jgi:hypothetical protein
VELSLDAALILSPCNIQTFWGLEAYQGSSDHDPGENASVGGVCKGKEMAWSRGLGMEVSPIKTRSAHKKLGSTPALGVQQSVSTHDMGALRGVKSLARAKI